MQFGELSLLVIICFFLGVGNSSRELARGKNTSASILHAQRWNSSNVVDGNNNTNIFCDSCLHTKANGESNAWWQVDLGRVYRINIVEFYSIEPYTERTCPSEEFNYPRYTLESDRLKGYSIYISNSPDWTTGDRCYKEPSGPGEYPDLYQNNSCVGYGSYLTIYTDHRATYDDPVVGQNNGACLTICEVKVYGCENGFHGINCTKECSQSCKDTICDPDTGECFQCEDGWIGPSCSERCPVGTYGYNCLGQCGNCLNGATCHHVTGECTMGCADGWLGIYCNTSCPLYTYGAGCISTCGLCRDNGTCINTNGTCTDGCEDGYTGHLCKAECPDGKYGSDCAEECGYCKTVSGCYHVNGTCTGGECQDGWTGSGCKTACAPGLYGFRCKLSCGQCFKCGNCDHRNGICIDGCANGYKMPLCHEECENGLYGRNCESACGYCSYKGICKKNDGSCAAGCQHGWTGVTCYERLAPDESSSRGHGDGVVIVLSVATVFFFLAFGIMLMMYISWVRNLPSDQVNKIKHQYFTCFRKSKYMNDYETTTPGADQMTQASEMHVYQTICQSGNNTTPTTR